MSSKNLLQAYGTSNNMGSGVHRYSMTRVPSKSTIHLMKVGGDLLKCNSMSESGCPLPILKKIIINREREIYLLQKRRSIVKFRL